MNEYIELLFSAKKEIRTFNFVPRCAMGSTRNGIEFCFNSQTVLILLLLLKTVCGIELLSFNKKIAVHLNPINILVNGCAHKPIVMLLDVSQTSHSVFWVRIRVAT